MPRLQYVALLFRLRAHALRRDRVPPHHPVGFGLFFFAIPTGFVRVAHSTPWLLYAASPCGEALNLARLKARMSVRQISIFRPLFY